jgi:D-alanyl-D-alanine carboxypeptidase
LVAKLSRRENAHLNTYADALRDALRSFIAQEHLPGGTAAAVLDGRLISVAAGYADVEAQECMRPESIMPCGSVGKTFLAAMLLKLTRHDSLQLDRTLDTWLGGESWFDRLPNGRTATLRMVLNHSGGIPDHRTTAHYGDAVRGLLQDLKQTPDASLPPTRLVSFILDAPPTFAAGSGFCYSETGYVIAGLILEKLSGVSALKLIRHELLAPLGLRRIRPALTRATPDLASGYIANDRLGFPAKTAEGGVLRFSPVTEFTGGGFYGASGDLARWVEALLEQRALPFPYREELLSTVPTGEARDVAYGLGIRVMHTPAGIAYGHMGEFPGYMTLAAYYLDQKIALAAQVNGWPHEKSLLERLQDALMKALRPAFSRRNILQ